MDERSIQSVAKPPVSTDLMRILEVKEIPLEAQDVSLDDPMGVFKVCLQMQRTCRESSGIGLSAVQVGIPWRLFIVGYNAMFTEEKHHRSKEHEYRYFVNCEYQPVTDRKITTIEGCLSLPNRRFQVSRWAEVHVEGFELRRSSGNMRFFPFSSKFVSDPSGYAGTVFQHEIDHHNGVTIDQHGKELAVHGTKFW